MNAAPEELLTEAQLDALLRGVFIDQHTTDPEISESGIAPAAIGAATVVFGSAQPTNISKKAEKIMHKRLGIQRTISRFYLNVFFMTVIGITACSIWWINREKKSNVSGWDFNSPGQNATAATTPASYDAAEKTTLTEAENNAVITSPSFTDSSTTADSTLFPATIPAQTEREGRNPSRRPEQYAFADDDIPVLSPKEITENNKLKLTMLRNLARKQGIIKIEPGKVIRGGEVLQTTQFEMKETEVTTQEYRVFLNDLIINGKYDEYLNAHIDSKGWAKNGIAGMDEKYMTPGYKSFPVVNIPRAGALLFCEWLTRSFDAAVQQKEIKYNDLGLRLRFELPYDIEWIRAARYKDLSVSYPWGSNSTQNTRGCFLANFSYAKSKEKVVPTNSECMSKSVKAKDAITTAGHSIDSLVTCPVTSYNPNDFGFYCMSGNVAEMVWKYEKGKPATSGTALALGGSWNSSCDNIRIESPEQYEGITTPSAEIGFRYVIRTVSKPLTEKVSYKTTSGEDRAIEVPVLGEQWKKQIEKSKKEMAENILNRKGYSLIPMGSYSRNDQVISLQSFYMQQYEVSNLEYRTFLYDLVIQKRYAEFERANVCGNCWTEEFKYSFNEPMDEHYFTHPAYDNYPVVNISRDGAKLYSTWLTQMTREEQFKKNKTAEPLNDMRLPAETEWEYAAHAGNDSATYPWNGRLMRNAKGAYLANFYEIKKDSTGKTYNDLIADGAFHTAPRNSYYPNNWGLYNMAGNVSEMVDVMKPDQNGKYVVTGIAAKGGNWFSEAKNLRIQSENEYEGVTRPTPQIGFRVVMTYQEVPR